MGQDKVSQCVIGLRSDASAPVAGQPQFMISADDQFAILRVRAAEWSFSGGRDIAVTIALADGSEQRPAAAVRGNDLIDIALGRPISANSPSRTISKSAPRAPRPGCRSRGSATCCRPTATAWPAWENPRFTPPWANNGG